MNNDAFSKEIDSGSRFTFGENWSRFLTGLDESKIKAAEQSLCLMLGVKNLEGKSFLDAGSGSGLFSLAARRLGASRIYSFDYDPQSVACTAELKKRFFPEDQSWTICQGSALDEPYMLELGQFDVVYSWGVLHHTGNMQQAFQNIVTTAAPGGKLFIAIYNDQGWTTQYWQQVKKLYNQNFPSKILMVSLHWPYLYGMRWLMRAITNRRTLPRGMSLWHDMIDWLGGYPFEAAKPENVFRFFRDHGFLLTELTTVGGRMGCNEFVFQRSSPPGSHPDEKSTHG